MKRLSLVLAALLASAILYAAVFAVVERPLTLGDLTRQLDGKLRYGASLPSPKLLIFAGSNGRYSHRCAEFSAVLNRPCVNGSIAQGIALDFLLDQYRSILQRGDLVYMPLEYSQYVPNDAEMHAGIQNAVLLRHHGDYLRALPAARLAETYAAYDLPFLFHGVAEMALAGAHFHRRTSIDTLTPQGDEAGHSAAKALVYANFLTTAPLPDTRVPASSDAQAVLSRFLVDAKNHGITVVGALPTTPDDTPIAEQDIARIRALFERNGQWFLATRNHSRYPRTCFYDTTYHLNATCQAAHSREAAAALKALLSRADP